LGATGERGEEGQHGGLRRARGGAAYERLYQPATNEREEEASFPREGDATDDEHTMGKATIERTSGEAATTERASGEAAMCH
jgi:hypothetical protein